MTCLTCAARVLRTFIHEPTPLLRRAPRHRFLPCRTLPQIRRTSSEAATSTPLLRDDDYIPFVPAPLGAERSLLQEELVGLQHRPPPAPSLGTWEPDILLRDEDGGDISQAAVVEGVVVGEDVIAKTVTPPAPSKTKKQKSKESSEPAALSKTARRKMERYGYVPPSFNEIQPSAPIQPVVEKPQMAPEKSKMSPKKAIRAAQRAARRELAAEIVAAAIPPRKQMEPRRPRDEEEASSQVAHELPRSQEIPERTHDEEQTASAPTGYQRPRKWELPALSPISRKDSISKLEHFVQNSRKKNLEPWRVQKAALAAKLGQQKWEPAKRLSPEAMEGLRALHAQNSVEFSTPNLAMMFKISKEAVRRILKSSWKPTAEESEKRTERWERRAERIWDTKIRHGDIKTKSMIKQEKELFMQRQAMREKLERFEEQGRGRGRGGRRSKDEEEELKSVGDRLL